MRKQNGIFKDAERGTWMIAMRVRIFDGTFKKLTKRGYRSQAEASYDKAKVVEEFKKKWDREVTFNDFGSMAKTWIDYRLTKVSLATVVNDRGILSSYILPKYSGKDIREIFDPGNLRAWRKEICSLPWQVSWRNKVLHVMTALLDFAYKRGFVDAEAFRLANLELEPMGADHGQLKQEKPIWNKEQFQAFIDTFKKGERYYILFMLLFHLGCRIGELCGLQWRDYDPEKRQIHIHQQANARLGTGKSEITQTKTPRGDRYELLSEGIAAMLNHLREEIGGTPEQFILFSSSKPRGQTPIRLALDRHIAMAGVPRLTPHGLRHTNDSWLLSTATTIEDVEVIARRNGHSTKQALDTYAHLVNKTQADLIDILGK